MIKEKIKTKELIQEIFKEQFLANLVMKFKWNKLTVTSGHSNQPLNPL